MKKRLTVLLSVFFTIMSVIPQVYAAYDLSTALDIIKSKAEIKKCGVVNTPVDFAENDFDSIIGKAEYVTIATLPEKGAGHLSLGGRELTAGQTITRKSLGAMKFVPVSDRTSEASFTFFDAAGDSTKYGVCTVYVLEGLNLAPVTKESSFDTGKNISYKGFLAAEDPEGDSVSYSVVSGARHGTLQLLDASTGFFMYTPRADFTGRDIFTFRATDAYGNMSPAMKVTIHINETESNTVFADMTNHWAHNSAIKAVSDGLLGGMIKSGELVFCPDEEVTRGDFLAVAMIAAGLESNIERVSETPFTDDSDIPRNIKSYAAAAYSLGIINGYPENGGVSFKSREIISRSEASCILSRILGLTESEEAPRLTSSSVPAWADGAFLSLSSCGILVGTGGGELEPNGAVTRAQAAQLYCNVKEYTEEREKEEAPKKRTLLNLFGLLG